MNLTKDEKDFIEDWEAALNNKNKFLLIRTLLFGASIGFLTSIFQMFDSDMSFHPEDFSLRFKIASIVMLSVFWFLFSLWQFNRNKKKYDKLMENKNSPTP